MQQGWSTVDPSPFLFKTICPYPLKEEEEEAHPNVIQQ